jgi:integrase/recombinase XerD
MSKLETILDEYLAVRRALGYKLYDTGLLLQQFVEFAEQSGAAYITTELALRWATQPAHARQTWWSSRLGVVRRFAQYCSCHDPRTQVPPPGLSVTPSLVSLVMSRCIHRRNACCNDTRGSGTVCVPTRTA